MSQVDEPFHVPVLRDRVVENLIGDPDGVYVDCTIGGGGHAEAIAESLSDRGLVIGLDRDPEAVEATSARLERFGRKVVIRLSTFGRLGEVLRDLDVAEVNGVLFDLGISSRQLDSPDRGFSYRWDGPLDMRMGIGCRLTAEDVVNSYPEERLAHILRAYGEERYSRRIAKGICQFRRARRIETTRDLADAVLSSIPPRMPQKTLSRVFQAIRIEVNGELEDLRAGLSAAADSLGAGGRICVITYHSLEDRAVKSILHRGGDRGTSFRPLGKFVPSPEEIALNPRSRSAKLRVYEKVSSVR